MECKNCNAQLTEDTKFCPQCGAKVVLHRLNTKTLITEFLVSFLGWANSFLSTLRDLVVRPDQVIDAYLKGVRKRYVSPFILVAVGAALSMYVFNSYSDQYLELSTTLGEKQFELLQENIDENDTQFKGFSNDAESFEASRKMQENILQYFNIVTFLLLPLYALISFLVFGRRLNYGEHLIVNSYLQGLSFFIGIIMFIISINTSPLLFYSQLIVIMIYYLYTYAKLLNFGLGKAILKFLLFIGVLLAVFIVITIIGAIVGIVGKTTGLL